MTYTAIPRHQRDNHEATDDAIERIRGLVHALDCLENGEAEEPNSPKSLALAAVRMVIVEKMEALNKLRSVEWVGIGGNAIGLTPAEIVAARGEVPAR